jgi:hypothetical protein
MLVSLYCNGYYRRKLATNGDRTDGSDAAMFSGTPHSFIRSGAKNLMKGRVAESVDAKSGTDEGQINKIVGIHFVRRDRAKITRTCLRTRKQHADST